MFGALNRFIGLDDTPSQKSKESAVGFQILRNKNNDIPIEPWYDFVVGINGRQLDNSNTQLFATEVRNCAGSSVSLTLWNAKVNTTIFFTQAKDKKLSRLSRKGQTVRNLAIEVPTPSPTLGLSLQWTPLSVTDNVWHILDVIPNSPADVAGLLPYGDYIVGTPEGDLHGEAGLSELVEDFLGRDLQVYVYNHEYAVTRIVTIVPSRGWGGSGALGCVLGFGALHRLPAPLKEPIAGPGETLFETARFSNEEHRPLSGRSLPQAAYPPLSADNQSSDLWTPASMTSPPPQTQFVTSPPSTGPPRGGKKPRLAAAAANMTFDDYFKEGEQKSREEDFAPPSKSVPPPPPPKSAGVPKSKTPDVETVGEENKKPETSQEKPGEESNDG
ncbi:MAG: hypothetical protein LQ342_001472 [Letrouitia transgressa]|nr:MAG: hypothetical protein LQ342_001472 [Letrouitia transgressa]